MTEKPPQPRPARGRPTSLMTALLAASGTFALFLIGALVWVWSVYWAPGPQARGEAETSRVTIQSGMGVEAMGATLQRAGVIRSAEMFRVAAGITGADRRIRAGEYEIRSRASLSAVLAQLTSGRVVRHWVTLPEGRSVAEAIDILNANTILTGEITELPPEGSLWPETYEVTRGEARTAVIARMRRAADENLARLWSQRAPGLVVRTPEEALILASIVEKETGVAEERPRVAGLFANRLRQGMRLESDPTIVYGVTGGRPLGRGIRQSELTGDNPYNTYLIPGLPPTPITNPGEAALHAVLNPVQTEDLFFVADGTGGHVFARTYDEHLANVARWRAIERARAGLTSEAVPGATSGLDPALAPPPTGEAVITVNPPGTPTPGGATLRQPSRTPGVAPTPQSDAAPAQTSPN